jgi:hypothetical protein
LFPKLLLLERITTKDLILGQWLVTVPNKSKNLHFSEVLVEKQNLSTYQMGVMEEISLFIKNKSGNIFQPLLEKNLLSQKMIKKIENIISVPEAFRSSIFCPKTKNFSLEIAVLAN